jgi:hypothetical protein
MGGEIFCTCPDWPWWPPSPLYNGYRVFPGGKERLGRDTDPSPPSSAIGHEREKLYLYSPCRLYGLYRASVTVQGCTLPLLYGESYLSVMVTFSSDNDQWQSHTMNYDRFYLQDGGEEDNQPQKQLDRRKCYCLYSCMLSSKKWELPTCEKSIIINEKLISSFILWID